MSYDSGPQCNKPDQDVFDSCDFCWFAVVFVQKMDYVMYLTVFDRLFDVPKERKNASYKA